MSKRLEDGVNLGPGLLKKQHIEMFSVDSFVLSRKKISHERVCSKHCSVKKWFTGSCSENLMKNAMG